MSDDAFLGHRLTYDFGALERAQLNDEPLKLLRRWLEEAEAHGTIEPSAMALATCDELGQPHARIVLLRTLDHGLVFYTNYESDKGRQLSENPRAAATFWWPTIHRQVRVEGVVERVTEEESEAYFATRPLDSRYVSAASPQSRPIQDGELEQRVADLRAAHPDGIRRPDHWGGYRLIPQRFEFWQGRPARDHDRFVYARTGERWEIKRLAP